MTHYRKADQRVIKLIQEQVLLIGAPAAPTGHPLSQDEVISIVCEMYENKDAIILEAGLK